uniref:Uncharacterized protein n=1 Tax=Timema bartmani TaxID=61472 RepID=A0A7R9I1X3_9NEOP|nr:unnamed protein product [Timema bartmani]
MPGTSGICRARRLTDTIASIFSQLIADRKTDRDMLFYSQHTGILLQGRDQFEEAIRSYELAIQYRPTLAPATAILNPIPDQCSCGGGSWWGVVQWREDLSLVVVAHLNLGQLLERMRRCDEAIQVYRRCSRLDGAHLKDPRTHEATKVSALLHLGRLYADQGRLTEAAQAYQEAVNKMPEYYPPQRINARATKVPSNGRGPIYTSKLPLFAAAMHMRVDA